MSDKPTPHIRGTDIQKKGIKKILSLLKVSGLVRGRERLINRFPRSYLRILVDTSTSYFERDVLPNIDYIAKCHNVTIYWFSTSADNLSGAIELTIISDVRSDVADTYQDLGRLPGGDNFLYLDSNQT